MNVSSLSRSPLLQTSNATREAALFCSDITIALLISAAHADAMIDEPLHTYKWIDRFAVAFAVKRRGSRYGTWSVMTHKHVSRLYPIKWGLLMSQLRLRNY